MAVAVVEHLAVPLTALYRHAKGYRKNPVSPALQPSFLLPLHDLGDGRVSLDHVNGVGAATFTRASAATCRLKNGLLKKVASGVPRAHYAADGTYLGYLSEGARTNLALYSEDFSHATWAKNSATATSGFTSPDGGTTAYKIVPTNLADTTANTSAGGITQAVTVSVSATWAMALYAKKGEVGLKLREGVASGAVVKVDLDTGAVTGSSSTLAVTATQWADGWWRVQCLRTTGPAESSCSVNIKADIDTGDGVSGVYVWGVQVEQAAFSSSYIPTTTASATRNADALTYPNAPHVQDSAGTAYAEIFDVIPSGVGTGGFRSIVRLGPGIGIPSVTQTDVQLNDSAAAATKVGIDDPTTGISKCAGAWETGAPLRMTGSGGSVTLSGPNYDGTMLGGNIGIAAVSDGTINFFGCVKNVRLWTSGLSSAFLQAITA